MGRRTRTCYLCGEKYEYCPTCSQDKLKPTWMAEFHSENCKDVFDICTRFNMQLLNKHEAKEVIEKCDLSNKLNFRPSVQNTLSNLLKADEDKITIDVDAEIKEITKDEVVVEVKPVTRGKSKSKAHEVVNKEENK